MKKRVNISLDDETIERLKELAEQSHRNVSQWITEAVWKEDKKIKKEEASNGSH